MADQHLRELERRWREGDVEAGAAWLRARVRAGELTQELIDQAASLGDPATVAAATVEPPGDDVGWFEALVGLGVDAVLRGALGAAWLVVPTWEKALAGNKRAERLRDALAAAELAWGDPSPAHVQAAQVCLERLVTRGTRDWADASGSLNFAWMAVHLVVVAVVDPSEAPGPLSRGWQGIRAVEGLMGESARRCVTAEVTPWLLGLEDPLLDRVEARAQDREGSAGLAALRARLAAGELQRSSLRLAAYVGSESADAAMRAVGELPSAIPDDFETWVLRSMAYGGLTAPVAMFLEIGRAVTGADPAYEVTARWVAEPTPEHATACLESAAAAGPVARLVPAAVAAVGLEQHRERRSALARLLESLVGHAAAAGLDEADLRRVIRDTLGEALLA